MITTDEETKPGEPAQVPQGLFDTGPHPNIFNLDSDAGYVAVAILGLLQMEINVKGEIRSFSHVSPGRKRGRESEQGY